MTQAQNHDFIFETEGEIMGMMDFFGRYMTKKEFSVRIDKDKYNILVASTEHTSLSNDNGLSNSGITEISFTGMVIEKILPDGSIKVINKKCNGFFDSKNKSGWFDITHS